MRHGSVPEDINVEVTRNYGATASDKADELLFHLALATVSIVLLIVVAIGWREGIVVAIVIPTTILLTLFASWIMGYTINRVSLFALIFSIGILVDDAIVVIENIARHWGMHDGRSRVQAAIEAVAEVGNPTIIATLTVVVALLPMLFVSGLMGPYMSPIPANASAAMIFSFFVAVMVTPWLMVRFGKQDVGGHGHDEGGGFLARAYLSAARPILRTRKGALRFLLAVGVATLLSLTLFYFKAVTVKLLPFDNKSEVQVVIDLPKGSSLEETDRILQQAAERIKTLPELTTIQSYAGTAAPFNFNGLVRHYYLRANPEQGDLQLNLTPKDARSRNSHQIALEVRERLKGLELPPRTALKVVEVPPGPPVLSTLLAEVYGPDARGAPRDCGQAQEDFREHPLHRGRGRQLRRAVRQAPRGHRPGQARILQGRAARRLRHDPGLSLRRAGRLFLPRRGPPSGGDRHRAAEEGAVGLAAHPVDAGAGQRHPRQPLHRRDWAMW